jgi:arylsulfatase A-like enzyme
MYALYISSLSVFIVFLFIFYRISIRKRKQKITEHILKLFESKSLKKIGMFVALLIVSLNLIVKLDRKINKSYSPNIIFICIDALRSDHLGCYGYNRDTSPFLDQLARKNIIFKKNITQSSWTKTSVATFMTSKYQTLSDVVEDEDKLPLSENTLAEILKDNGYSTLAYVSNPWLKTRFGFDQGFDYYNEDAVKTLRIEVEDVCKYILKVKDSSFFLYVHFMDVHNPYNPPSPFKEVFTKNLKGSFVYDDGPMPDINEDDLEYTKGLYDGEIRFVDEKIRHIFNFLEDQNLLKKTVVIINSDHGDEFLEHGGMGHGTTLYNELLFVPLIFVPNNEMITAQSVVHSFVRNIDILPTILEVSGIPIKNPVDGRSLLSVIKGKEKNYSHDLVLSRVKSKSTKDELLSIYKGKYKYIFNITQGRSQLFNIEKDIWETEDLSKINPGITMEIQNIVIGYLSQAATNREKTKIDEETLEQLKSLGYIK